MYSSPVDHSALLDLVGHLSLILSYECFKELNNGYGLWTSLLK